MSIHFDTTPVFDGTVTSLPDIALLREDTYVVLAPDRTMGYVRKVDNLFVGMLGDDLLHADQIGQSLSFDVVVDMITAAHHARR